MEMNITIFKANKNKAISFIRGYVTEAERCVICDVYGEYLHDQYYFNYHFDGDTVENSSIVCGENEFRECFTASCDYNLDEIEIDEFEHSPEYADEFNEILEDLYNQVIEEINNYFDWYEKNVG